MFSGMFPELYVSDCEAAAQFFEKALGYRRGYTVMEGDRLRFAAMDHSDPGLKLTLHGVMPVADSSQPRTVRLYYELNDIQALVGQLRAKGFTVTDPHPTNYGATTANMKGPDSYVICFLQWERMGGSE